MSADHRSTTFLALADRTRSWASLAGLAVLVACGGGDNGTSPIVKGFSITLSSTTLSVQAGSSGSVTASITRTGEFSGTIDLSVESLPAGITASFAPSSITVSTTSTTLTVNAATTVAPGNYSFTIRGKSAGLTDQTGSVTVTVTAAPAYTMTLAPAALSIQAGASGHTTVTLVRTNFTAGVTLALEGAPAGVTGAFAANPLTTDNTTLTINVAASAVAGASTLTVRGTATGLTDRTATLTLTVTAAPAITLTLTPSAATVQQGGNTSVAVAITRTNFPDAVTLAVSGAPAGVTATITTSPTTTNAATIALAIGAAVPASVYTLTVTGSGTGISNATATFTLTITVTPSVSMTLSPNAATVQQGNNAAFTVDIARTNFTGAVTIAVTNVPAGVTPVITTSPTTGNSVSIQLNVGLATALGTSTLTITGSGAGIAIAAKDFQLTVTQAPAGNVTWNFCGGSTTLPVWLAVSNDGGAFQHIVGANNTYNFTIGARGIVAYVTTTGTDEFLFTENYGTVADLQALANSHCPTAGPKSLIANVVGLNATTTFDHATVSVGSGFGIASYNSPTANVTGVPDGALDIVSTRIPASNGVDPVVANKIFIQRAQNLASGSSFPVDFNSGNAFDLEQHNLFFTNKLPGVEIYNATVTLTTATNSFGFLSSTTLPAPDPATFRAVPAAKEIAGDLHVLTGFAHQLSGNFEIGTRIYTEYFMTPGNYLLPFGSPLNVPTITNLASVPYARFRVQLQQQAEYNRSWTFYAYNTNSAGFHSVSFTGTPNYFGSGVIDFQLFDFTSVDGWNNLWGPRGGDELAFSMAAVGWRRLQPGVDGAVIISAVNLNKFTP